MRNGTSAIGFPCCCHKVVTSEFAMNTEPKFVQEFMNDAFKIVKAQK